MSTTISARSPALPGFSQTPAPSQAPVGGGNDAPPPSWAFPNDGFVAAGAGSVTSAGLDAPAQLTLGTAVASLKDPSAQANVTRLLSSEGFRGLSPESQAQALAALLKAPGDAQLAADLKSLVNDGGPYATLREGSSGPAVRVMQDQLRRAGFDEVPRTGTFDAATAKALRQFQGANQLPGDGVATPETLGRLAGKSFTGLDQASQTALLRGLGERFADPAAREQLTAVALLPSFRGLSADTRAGLLAHLSAAGPEGAAAREDAQRLLDDGNFGTTPSAQQAQLARLEHGLTSLDTLAKNPAFQALDPHVRAQAFEAVHQHSSVAGKEAGWPDTLSKVVTDPSFAALGKADQARVLDVLKGSTSQGHDAMLKLLHATIGGQPALLSRGVNPGTPTLLQELDTASKQAAFAHPHEMRLTDLLEEVSDPGHFINQDNRGTCTATAISYQLALSNPAEYARIQTDLFSKGATTLADGSTMKAPPMQDEWSTRSDGERLMQSAFMQYGRPDVPYSNNDQRPHPDSTNPNGEAKDGFADGGVGLPGAPQNRLLHGLFNKDFTSYDGSFFNGNTDRMDELKRQLEAGKGPVLISLDWGDGSHAVSVTKIENGRVFFRNPWGGDDGQGGGVGKTGQVHEHPARRTEDGWGGIESMQAELFKARITSVHVEK